MKILILSNIGSGLYKFRRELVEALIVMDDEVTVAFPEDEYAAQFTAMGCRYTDVKMNRRGMNPFSDIRIFFFYMKLLRQQKPDVVLTYTIKPNVYGGLACQLTKTPYFSNVTGLGTAVESGGIVSKLTTMLYKIGLRKSDCIFFQNAENMAYFKSLNICGKKIHLLPGSGVNLTANPYCPYPSAEEEVNFLTVGRIMRDKGIDELLFCAKEICSRHGNVKFTLVGMYDDVKYVEKIDRGVADGYLTYLGQRSDVAKLMANSHCIIHPSYHEGLSNVLLESAACGRPVITSDVHGCRETFDEGLSGFGVQAGSGESLTAAVERFLTLSNEERERMGRSGRKKMEQEFDRNIVIGVYMDERNQVMEK